MGRPLDGEPIPLNFLLPRQPIASDQVFDKVKKIQHAMGLCCEQFEDQFIALLIAIKAGHTQSPKLVTKNKESLRDSSDR